MSLKTFFAPAERSEDEELAIEIELVSQNAIVSGLLQSVSGVLAIVNDKRQVISFNETFMQLIGVDDPQKILGLRPGQILQCIYAENDPGGCGTTKHCTTCGAAIAMVTSLGENKPAERTCALQAKRGKQEIDVALSVRAHPIKIDSRKFLLLFLQDITLQQQRAALERTFYHDISNLMSMLVGASELLIDEVSSPLAENVHHAAVRLQQEISIQRCLSEGEYENYTPMWHRTTSQYIFDELQLFFKNHPTAKNKYVRVHDENDAIHLKTDISLILRVLSNMITNGLEASDEGEEVTLWTTLTPESVAFHVKNRSVIDEEIQSRIFQRNFSSKSESGRGIGTYSMKLLGEKILGGKVNFISSQENGTIFSITLPR